MRANSKDPQPVRLANPTAEGFVASLKVVHFFAILFFWLALVALLLHIAAFVVYQRGMFDEALGLQTEEAIATAAADESESSRGAAMASDEAESSAEIAAPAPSGAGYPVSERDKYIVQLIETMRLAGLLASILLLVTLFVYLEISLLGRLAGVQYLTLSFFLIMLYVATVYNWQPLLPGMRILGSLFVLDDFLDSYTRYVHRGDALLMKEAFTHYARFLIMPIVSLVLLVFSWLRFRRGYEESVLMNE